MADSNLKILIVEDEKPIRELMALHVLRQGLKVVECASVEEALEAISKEEFAVVVLDWMLPGLSGMDFLDILKNRKTSPAVLMVTARTAPEDIVQGLERGADDFLTKPFEPSVFIARIKALLRRFGAVQKEKLLIKYQLGDLLVDTGSHQIYLRDEKLHLTPSEYKLIAVMFENQGKVLTREQLIENIQGEGISVVGRTIDTHIFGLRKKLKDWGDNIETIRGVGYRINFD